MVLCSLFSNTARRFLNQTVFSGNKITSLETCLIEQLHSRLTPMHFCNQVLSTNSVCAYSTSSMVSTQAYEPQTRKSVETAISNLNTEEFWKYENYIDITLYLLRDIGLKHEEVVATFKTCSELLHSTIADFEYIRAVLSSFAFTFKQIKTLIKRCPQLLLVKPEDIKKKLTSLLNIAFFTTKDLPKLCVNAPCVIFDDLESTLKKINYVTYVMSDTNNTAVAESGAFKLSVFQMEMRHEFLHRRGQYFQQDRHGNTKIENPSLKDMFNTNISDFCKDIAKCTEHEFRMFEQLFSIETSYLNKMEIESESDADVEEEDNEPYNHKQNIFADELLNNLK